MDAIAILKFLLRYHSIFVKKLRLLREDIERHFWNYNLVWSVILEKSSAHNEEIALKDWICSSISILKDRIVIIK
jgi:hypothetical protein